MDNSNSILYSDSTLYTIIIHTLSDKFKRCIKRGSIIKFNISEINDFYEKNPILNITGDIVNDDNKIIINQVNILGRYLPKNNETVILYYKSIGDAIKNRDRILSQYPETEKNYDFGMSKVEEDNNPLLVSQDNVQSVNPTVNPTRKNIFGLPNIFRSTNGIYSNNENSDFDNKKSNLGGYRKKSRRLARKTKRVRKGKGTKRRGRRRTSKLG